MLADGVLNDWNFSALIYEDSKLLLTTQNYCGNSKLCYGKAENADSVVVTGTGLQYRRETPRPQNNFQAELWLYGNRIESLGSSCEGGSQASLEFLAHFTEPNDLVYFKHFYL